MLSVYITDLSAYNSGFLSGSWVQLPLDSFELSQTISEVLAEGEHVSGEADHEELFITDYEWDELDLFEVDEYDDPFELNDQIKLLADLDKDRLKAVRFLLDEGITLDLEDAISRAEDVIIHHNYDMEDVAYDLIQNSYRVDDLPSLIANNIDYDGVARDLEYEGIYWERDGDVYEYIG